MAIKLTDITDIDLLEMRAIWEARGNFWAYRRWMSPKMKLGWWQKGMAVILQQFYDDMVLGKRPKLAISAPPQHGKSQMVVDFISWVAGKNPDAKAIYASYSKRLGVRANKKCQKIYSSARYKKVFSETRINEAGSKDANKGTKNSELIEYTGAEGYFRNTTVEGAITGESLDIGVIDDPIKGRKQAGSALNRDSVWEWFVSDFFTRFSEDASFLTIATRWHVDDPIGRLKEKFGDELKVVSYGAIAEEDEENRSKGEALFPKLKSVGFLLERKSVMSSVEWEEIGRAHV